MIREGGAKVERRKLGGAVLPMENDGRLMSFHVGKVWYEVKLPKEEDGMGLSK